MGWRASCPSAQTHLRTFWTSMPATIPIVVGSEAAQTPSRFNVRSYKKTVWRILVNIVRDKLMQNNVDASLRQYPKQPRGVVHIRNKQFGLVRATGHTYIHSYFLKRAPQRSGMDVLRNRTWMWPFTASSDTPDSIQTWSSSLHAWFTAILAPKLSTALKTKSTLDSPSRPPWRMRPIKCSKFSEVVMS